MKLRKCTTTIYNKESKKYEPEECYFHGWTQVGEKKLHPEDPQQDHVYSVTLAIVEHIRTGKILQEYPTEITFIS